MYWLPNNAGSNPYISPISVDAVAVVFYHLQYEKILSHDCIL